MSDVEVKEAPGQWRWPDGVRGWMLWRGTEQVAWFGDKDEAERVAEFLGASVRELIAAAEQRGRAQAELDAKAIVGTVAEVQRLVETRLVEVYAENQRLKEAVAAEREACAKVAENIDYEDADYIAAAIRARKDGGT